MGLVTYCISSCSNRSSCHTLNHTTVTSSKCWLGRITFFLAGMPLEILFHKHLYLKFDRATGLEFYFKDILSFFWSPLERGQNVFKTKFKSSCTRDLTLEKLWPGWTYTQIFHRQFHKQSIPYILKFPMWRLLLECSQQRKGFLF